MTQTFDTHALADANAPRPGPHGTRLLADWFSAGTPTGLDRHLERHGPLPLDRATGGRRGTAPLLARMAEDAGLTGRGGAAFPTGRKLRTVAEARGPAVVVANGMESEPASGKDQALLHLVPHLVLDGIQLAARTVGATAAHLCLARTRPEQISAVRDALDERERLGLDLLPVQVHALPHHYVSSEETSLVHWLNGGDAKPLATPPRPFQKGVDRRPTLIDNVETLAHLALIARYGPEWFRSAGAPDAPGTTLLTVTGAVHRPGVQEAPMGERIGALLDRAGGATEPLQAVLAGGYFGTWLPAADAAGCRFTRDELARLDAGPGAGVLVALPHSACGLAETAAVLGFLARNSARQCGPCLFGLPAVAEDFAALAWGRDAEPGLYERLRRRVGLLAGRGACRHPDGASRLAASALRAFADDVERHLRLGPCPGAARPPVLDVPQGPVPADAEWR